MWAHSYTTNLSDKALTQPGPPGLPRCSYLVASWQSKVKIWYVVAWRLSTIISG
ncbi:hypothetical protein HMPREF0201_00742 [Cedecea davisae DSM 4568]|uniref:Uncharacterized protein n=1 Tax=Cedecea davisae DSM 4568 TaxID=566551 RepID=S3JJ37_9ENTR|nr:hypothetical protein HMPREF0201_00742 [Cedecea davisae DSM 4568]